MPIIKSAKKALRQTKRRTIRNKTKKLALRSQLTKFKKQRGEKQLSVLYSLIDKMVKNKIIHKNKSGRIKSRLIKSLNKGQTHKDNTTSKTKKRNSK